MSAFKTWHIRRNNGGGAGGIATEVDSIATPLANAAQAKADANEAAIAALEVFGSNLGPVVDIAARDALTPATGDKVFVVDATADGTVTLGAASYVYDGAAWIKYSEAESLERETPDPATGTQDQIIAIDAAGEYELRDLVRSQWQVTDFNDLTGTIDDGRSNVFWNFRGNSAVAVDLYTTPYSDGDQLVLYRDHFDTGDLTVTLTGDDTVVLGTPLTFVGLIGEGAGNSDTITLAPGEAVKIQRVYQAHWRVISRSGAAPVVGSSEALIEVKDSADAGTVKWTPANGLFEYVIPQADHGIPVGRRAAGISAYLASSDELTDIEVIHSKTTGDITVRSTGDLAVDIEIIGAAA